MVHTLADNSSPRHTPVRSRDEVPPSDLSCLYTLLPTVVKSRIPILPSIRSSVIALATSTQPRSTSHSSPPAESRSRADSGVEYGNLDDEIITRKQLRQLTKRDTQSLSVTARPAPHMSPEFGLLPPDFETRSGVDWNTATPGIMLLNNARYQSARQLDANPGTLRSLHIDGLTYLIRALPKDLTVRELRAIEHVLPEQLQGNTKYNQQAGTSSTKSQSEQDQNVIHRSITYTIIQLAMFVAFALPLVTKMLSRCVRYERQNQITERVVTKGIVIAETVGVRGRDLTDALVKFSQGKLGGALSDAGTWILEGVAGGISDGVGQGMMVVARAVISSPPPSSNREGKEVRQ